MQSNRFICLLTLMLADVEVDIVRTSIWKSVRKQFVDTERGVCLCHLVAVEHDQCHEHSRQGMHPDASLHFDNDVKKRSSYTEHTHTITHRHCPRTYSNRVHDSAIPLVVGGKDNYSRKGRSSNDGLPLSTLISTRREILLRFYSLVVSSLRPRSLSTIFHVCSFFFFYLFTLFTPNLHFTINFAGFLALSANHNQRSVTSALSTQPPTQLAPLLRLPPNNKQTLAPTKPLSRTAPTRRPSKFF